MRKIYINLGLLACLLVCNVSFADVQVWKLKQPKEVYPVANDYETSHNVGKCSSQRTKRRAHMYSSHNLHKKLDNELILGSYEYCCSYEYYDTGATKSKKCDPQCVDIARLSKEREKASGRRGIVQGLGILGGSVLGLSGVTLLGN